ncbi:glycosyltransferase family 4 protein [Patescibacteria group bacterium]|nr:glycosyltransferase family 4 protein [Patescibacteria group bacterium]MBU1907295.1 glycosyltransferase family 4 protein [Patescibacteria group bacterium]
MKIGIDARLYGPKVGGGGLGRYVEELITNLQQIDNKNRYVLFLKKDNFDACKITNKNFTKVEADVHWYSMAEQLKMPKIIDAAKCDLVHYPHWNIAMRAKTPFVVTIHDLIMLDEPTSAKATTRGPLHFAAKRAGYKLVLSQAIKKSRHIIAVSNYTKSSILKHFEIDPKKISVTLEGVVTPKSKPQATKSPYQGPYFLYVGNAYPHKNLEALLHAFALFHKLHPKVKLVLVGKQDVFWKWLEKEIDEIEVPRESVVFYGYASEEELDQLYEHATLYLFPSRHEGFGLPPLEAMARGVPVAASEATAIPEILGDAAIYFKPDDLERMVEVMEQGLTDEKLRKNLKDKGQSRVKKYSWKTMAEETLKVYNQFAK